MFSSTPRPVTLQHHHCTVAHRIGGKENQRTSLLHTDCHLDLGSPKHASSRSRSNSKQKRISNSKLFAKAHRVTDKETYLTPLKSKPHSAHPHSAQHRSEVRTPRKVCELRSLVLRREFDIKISGGSSATSSHTLSRIIEFFGGELKSSDLSSIHESSEDAVEVDGHTLLRLIQAQD